MTTKRQVLIRFKDSGDWFSPVEYRAAMRETARREAWLRGYGYTKRLDILHRTPPPANVAIVQSVGGTMDAKIDPTRPHSKVFGSHADRVAANYVDGTASDVPAAVGETRIGLVYHGAEHAPLDVPRLDMRGGIELLTEDRIIDGVCVGVEGEWLVSAPMGIKRRKMNYASFDLAGIRTEDLHCLIPVKTGNVKVKETARKLGEIEGVRYRPAAYNTPALSTCAAAGICSGFCYALQGTFGFRSSRWSRARTWAVLREAQRRGGEETVGLVLGMALDTLKPRGYA